MSITAQLLQSSLFSGFLCIDLLYFSAAQSEPPYNSRASTNTDSRRSWVSKQIKWSVHRQTPAERLSICRKTVRMIRDETALTIKL